MASPILWAGQEAESFLPVGAFSAAVGGNNTMQLALDTTAGHYRAGYARYGLFVSSYVGVTGTSSLTTTTYPNQQWWGSPVAAFSASTFWFSARCFNNQNVSGNSDANSHVWRLVDANGVVRLRARASTAASVTSTWVIEKVDAAGTATTLGTTSSGWRSAPATPDKLDVFVNYAVAGQVTVYINGASVLSYAGDITTDGQTALSGFHLVSVAQMHFSGAGTNGGATWSEIIVATADTRAMSLVTQTATALGNADTFTGGAVANINANQAQDASPDFSTSAGQVQQYKVTPAPPTGNFSVISVVQHARVAIGSTGPSKIDFMVRTGGADFLSANLVPGAAWGLAACNWDTNPNTGNPWSTGDLPTNSTAFNFGYKSVA